MQLRDAFGSILPPGRDSAGSIFQDEEQIRPWQGPSPLICKPDPVKEASTNAAHDRLTLGAFSILRNL